MQKTVAYPNYSDLNIHPQYNMNKWMTAVKDIYSKTNDGFDRVEAIRDATKEWVITEIYDFLNWLRYYEEGAHLKYKFSQLWFDPSSPAPKRMVRDSNNLNTPENHMQNTNNSTIDVSSEEQKRLVEIQKNKMIGRLDSLEKLVRTPGNKSLLGEEFENLIQSVFELKRKIYSLHKKTSSTKTYDDMIVREANILKRQSLNKAASFLVLAADQMPEPASADPPTQSSGAPGGFPSMGPGMAQNPPNSAPNNMLNPSGMGSPQSKGINDFIKNLNTGGSITVTEKEKHNEAQQAQPAQSATPEISVVEPTPEVKPSAPSDKAAPKPPTAPDPKTQEVKSPEAKEIKPVDKNKADDGSILVSEGQALDPMPKPEVSVSEEAAPVPVKTQDLAQATPLVPKENRNLIDVGEGKSPNIEVGEGGQEGQESTNRFDNEIDKLLSSISINDIINKLEDVSKIFKVREIPRQLGIVDMMLDALGLSPYFPSLSEATNKALESNNYISTRIDDILSKLKGSMDTKSVDLMGDDRSVPEQSEGVVKSLQNEKDKDLLKKKMKKDQEDAILEGAKPEIEIEEPLEPQPKPVPAAPAAPVAPKAPVPNPMALPTQPMPVK